VNGSTVVRRDERHGGARNIDPAQRPLKSESASHRAG
jgi:hypothetical protein